MTSIDMEMALVAAQARVDRPRLFAVHGLSNDGKAILGWGMEFANQEDAVFYLPAGSVMHHTASAESVVQRFSALGDVEVTWFDED